MEEGQSGIIGYLQPVTDSRSRCRPAPPRKRKSARPKRAVQGRRQAGHPDPVQQAADRCDHQRGHHETDVFYADSPVAGFAIAQPKDTLEAPWRGCRRDQGGRQYHQKGDSDTARPLQAALQKLMDDGTYMKISSIGASNPAPSTRPNQNPTDLSPFLRFPPLAGRKYSRSITALSYPFGILGIRCFGKR